MTENSNTKNNKEDKPKVESSDSKKEDKKDTGKGAAQAVAKSVYGEKQRARKIFRKGPRGRPDRKDEYEQRILDIARVTRVMAGGKRMSFRACVVIGDKKGKVAVALGKGADVTMAIGKAVNKAKKDMIDVPIVNNTIPHEIYLKQGAARLLFKPARRGRGVIAGGVVRVILEIAGVQNVTSKILGTNNKINNAKCTIEALRRLKRVEVKKKDKKNSKSPASAEAMAGKQIKS